MRSKIAKRWTCKKFTFFYEYLLKVLRKEIPIKVISDKEISIKAFEDLREGMQYKFTTPFDSDYVALNGYLKSKKNYPTS